MIRIPFLSLILASSLLAACGSQIEDLESGRPTSNVATTETDGVVSATISASASGNQILVGSANSKAADATVIFPPGSLSVDTGISIGEATDQSAAIVAELGANGLVQAGSPVYIGPTAAEQTVTVVQPLTIQLPLPLEKLDITGLTAGESKLALIYTIFNNGWKSGLIPLTAENLLGAYLKVQFSGLGYFQVAYFATATATAEASSNVRPALGKNVDQPAGNEPGGNDNGGTALADYQGFYAGTVTQVSNSDGPGGAPYCVITSDNFKMWLSNSNNLLYKVGTPKPESTSAAFDGSAALLGELSASTNLPEFSIEWNVPGATPSITAEGFSASGVKYSSDDQYTSKSFTITLNGGFTGTTTRTYAGTLRAFIGTTKVCEYTLALTKD